jgi:hypothetical protein
LVWYPNGRMEYAFSSWNPKLSWKYALGVSIPGCFAHSNQTRPNREISASNIYLTLSMRWHDTHTGLNYTTGTSLCADSHMLRRRPNIGAVGVARRHGRLTNGPSGQNSRRRSLLRPDGMPSAQRGRRFSTPPWSQPFGPAQRRYHAGPEPTACRRLSI